MKTPIPIPIEALKNSSRKSPTLFVGADVAKDKIDFSIDGYDLQTANDPEALRKLFETLEKHLTGSLVIACEATSRYHHSLLRVALEQGLEVYQLNARQVRDYAKSHNLLAKTDRLDAAVISRFIKDRREEHRPVKSDWIEGEIGLQLHSRVRHLIAQRATQKAARHHYPDTRIQEEIEETIAYLSEQIESYLREIESHIKTNESHAGLYEELQKEVSIAQKGAMALLISLPELGKVNRNEIAALVGLAPMNWDSGKMRGQRHIKGGRESVRSVIYQCAVVASKHHPELKDFYQSLRSRGKCAKVAFVAVARKLVIKLNTRAKNYYASI